MEIGFLRPVAGSPIILFNFTIGKSDSNLLGLDADVPDLCVSVYLTLFANSLIRVTHTKNPALIQNYRSNFRIKICNRLLVKYRPFPILSHVSPLRKSNTLPFIFLLSSLDMSCGDSIYSSWQTWCSFPIAYVVPKFPPKTQAVCNVLKDGKDAAGLNISHFV